MKSLDISQQRLVRSFCDEARERVPNLRIKYARSLNAGMPAVTLVLQDIEGEDEDRIYDACSIATKLSFDEKCILTAIVEDPHDMVLPAEHQIDLSFLPQDYYVRPGEESKKSRKNADFAEKAAAMAAGIAIKLRAWLLKSLKITSYAMAGAFACVCMFLGLNYVHSLAQHGEISGDLGRFILIAMSNHTIQPLSVKLTPEEAERLEKLEKLRKIEKELAAKYKKEKKDIWPEMLQQYPMETLTGFTEERAFAKLNREINKLKQLIKKNPHNLDKAEVLKLLSNIHLLETELWKEEQYAGEILTRSQPESFLYTTLDTDLLAVRKELSEEKSKTIDRERLFGAVSTIGAVETQQWKFNEMLKRHPINDLIQEQKEIEDEHARLIH